jgi:hypothetical protein
VNVSPSKHISRVVNKDVAEIVGCRLGRGPVHLHSRVLLKAVLVKVQEKIAPSNHEVWEITARNFLVILHAKSCILEQLIG